MPRNIIIAFAVIILLLASALAFVLLRGQPRPAPIEVNAAEADPTLPYREEMDCIDRLMRKSDLLANQVEPELARCRGGAPTSQTNGQ
jgi:hypothetical protein